MHAAVSKGNTYVFGTFGRRQYYTVSVKGNLRPLVCCEGKGYRNGKAYWGSLGCRNSGSVSGSVEWGNVAAYPEVRCKGDGLGGAFYSFNC